jgi:hypothetical protein
MESLLNSIKPLHVAVASLTVKLQIFAISQIVPNYRYVDVLLPVDEITKILAHQKFHLSCHNMQSKQIADFIRISKIKTPSPIPETGSYDPSICSPF